MYVAVVIAGAKRCRDTAVVSICKSGCGVRSDASHSGVLIKRCCSIDAAVSADADVALAVW